MTSFFTNKRYFKLPKTDFFILFDNLQFVASSLFIRNSCLKTYKSFYWKNIKVFPGEQSIHNILHQALYYHTLISVKITIGISYSKRVCHQRFSSKIRRLLKYKYIIWTFPLFIRLFCFRSRQNTVMFFYTQNGWKYGSC